MKEKEALKKLGYIDYFCQDIPENTLGCNKQCKDCKEIWEEYYKKITNL